MGGVYLGNNSRLIVGKVPKDPINRGSWMNTLPLFSVSTIGLINTRRHLNFVETNYLPIRGT